MRQYEFFHPVLVAFTRLSFASIIVGGLAAAFVSWPVGFCLVLSGLLWILASRLSTARRYIVDPTRFRIPRYPALSSYLMWNRKVLRWVNIGGVVAFTAVSFWAFSETVPRYISIAVLSLLAGPPLFGAIKMLIKFRVDTFFRIVVFRRNVSAVALAHKADVMPACGCFGQVLLLTDETLSKAWEGGWMRMDQWVLSESYQPLIADTDPGSDEWREVVLTQLSYADFVVFDWSDEISENMAWEFQQAMRLIPQERMLMLAGPESQTRMEKLRETLPDDNPPDIEIALAPDDSMTRALFMNRFEMKMRQLVVSTRDLSVHPEKGLARLE